MKNAATRAALNRGEPPVAGLGRAHFTMVSSRTNMFAQARSTSSLVMR